MSSLRPDRKPLIALVDRANRALQADMVRTAHAAGYPHIKQAHNAVFATLPAEGERSAVLAARAGITRQSMGEIVRDLERAGVVEMTVDPSDRRAKLVSYTEYGRRLAHAGFAHITALEEQFAEEFGPREYEIARDVLARVVDLLAQEPQG